MSFTVHLVDKNGNIKQVETHAEGATIAIDKPFVIDNKIYGGTNDACLDITYNYSPYYYQTIDKEKGLRKLDFMKAKDAIPLLKKAIKILGTKPASDYWARTPGNAGKALATLLTWAEQHPEATFVIQ